MPSWKKHFQVVSANPKVARNAGVRADYAGPGAYGNKFVSYLPEIYSGAPNRLERYQQYDQMDQDSEVHSSLDTISDFATNIPESEDVPFEIFYKGKEGPTQAEVDLLTTALQQWCSINLFKQRIWRIFRSTIKYGDQFFIRDPETFELYWVDPYKIQSVVVNPAEGKKPEFYLVNDLDINIQTKVATIPRSQAINQIQSPSMVNNPAGAAGASTAYNNQAQSASWVGKTSGVAGQGINELAVNAAHVVHISLSEGLDSNWPFGNSILESIFKVYKQKELLEDALIIYRVQRAPERRVFYVDVGNMPVHKAMAYVERIKNEIHQRRIPNRTGGGTSIMDAAYNPLSIMEDYFFPTSAEGRGSKVDTLPGGENLGQIDDLRFFNNKLMRGLRVPSAYLPTGPDDGQQAYTDGRVGTAYIQEFRFSKYVIRLQNLIIANFDLEFKLFLAKRGIRIDSSSFELRFWLPQNFGKYRQMEIDAAQINIFQPMADVKWLSKRFLAKRFLGLTDKEVLENERMWLEENPKAAKNQTASGVEPGLGAVGIRPISEIGALDTDFGADLAKGTDDADNTTAPTDTKDTGAALSDTATFGSADTDADETPTA
jgi:hypothetical protein